MTPNSQQNLFHPFYHPEAELEAYALGGLEVEEAIYVESHLETCFHCSRTLAAMEEAALALAQAAPQQTPSVQLRNRIMEAVNSLPPTFIPEPSQPTRAAVNAERATEQSFGARFNLGNFALPLAATLVVGLFTASLVMNLVTSNRLNDLEQENSVAGVRLNQLELGHATANNRLDLLSSGNSQTTEALSQVMATSYLLANPTTRPMRLQPINGNSDSEGLLLVTNDGRKAVLMLANMEQPPPARSYQVWLSKNGQRVPMGPINVDSAGWGTMDLHPPESLYGFDWVNLTMEEPMIGETPTGEMVLQTRIVSPPSR